MRIEAFADADEVGRAGAVFTAGEARAAVAARGRFVMAVSGGHTPWKMLRALADQPLPWAQVHVVQVDERVNHGGFRLKEDLAGRLRLAGHDLVDDFGADKLSPDDDCSDFVVPLARAVAAGTVERGVAICGSGVGASICANQIPGVRAGLIHDHCSAAQGIEDDHMNIICIGGRIGGPTVAWELVHTFLASELSKVPRHLRRLSKVALLVSQARRTDQ